MTEPTILNIFTMSPFDEVYLPSVNRKEFEYIESKTIFDKKFKNKLSTKNTLHIIIGMDSGLLANYVMSNPIPAGSKYIFIELTDITKLLNIDIEPSLTNKITVCNFDEFKEIITLPLNSIFITKDSVNIHKSLAASHGYLSDYISLANDVEKVINDAIFEESVGLSQKIFFHEQFRNLSENQLPASILRGKFVEYTSIIVAGGPSLDNNIDWIRENQKKLIIISVSRVAGRLYDAGIIPHIIVSVDPADFSFEVNRAMMPLSEHSLFVNAYHVSSRLLSQWCGKNLYLGPRLPWEQTTDANNIDTIGPTVTNAALHLAMEMGCKKILLTGADFCFSKSGFTHAKGSLESSLGPNLGIICDWVETYSGELAESVIQLQLAAQSLQEDVKKYPNIHVINLSINAVKLSGITYQDQNDLTLTLTAQLTPTQLLASIPDISYSIEKKLLIERTTSQLDKLKTELSEINRLATEALLLTKKIEKKENKSNVLHIRNIDAIESKLNRDHYDLCYLIKFYGYHDFSTFLTSKAKNEWDLEQTNKMSIDYYNAFINNTTDLIKQCSEAKDRLSARYHELQNDTNLTLLAKQWRKDNQPGRIHIWLKNHPEHLQDKPLRTSDRILIADLKREYDEQCHIKPHTYIDAVQKTSSMEKVSDKINLLVHSQHLVGLTQISNNLRLLISSNTDQNNDDSDNIKALYHFAYANQLYLEKNDEEALTCLLSLDDSLKNESIYRLQLKLALKLADLHLAESTIKKILQYSDEYLPQLANILKLKNDVQGSVNIYLDYLEKYPSDIMTWLKLGLYMVEINQLEAAHTAFSNALDADPHNEMAKRYLIELNKLC